jgi:hypothetical protein
MNAAVVKIVCGICSQAVGAYIANVGMNSMVPRPNAAFRTVDAPTDISARIIVERNRENTEAFNTAYGSAVTRNSGERR